MLKRDRERERETDRQTDRQTDREREREREQCCILNGPTNILFLISQSEAGAGKEED